MATDHSHDARVGIVTRLKSDTAVTAIVGQRVYGEKAPVNPVYPMVRVGLMIASPYSPTCISGMKARFNIDSVSAGADASEAYALTKAVTASLHEQFFPLSDAAHVLTLDWLSTTPRQEEKLWRMMSAFSLTTQQA